MDQLLVWVGAGLVTAGVSAAILVGAGAASADSGAGAESGGAPSSNSSSPSTGSDSSGSDAPGTRSKPTAETDADKPTATKPDPKPDPDAKGDDPDASPATEDASDDVSATPETSELTGQSSRDTADRPTKRTRPTADPVPDADSVTVELVAKHVVKQSVSVTSETVPSLVQAAAPAAPAPPTVVDVIQGVITAVVVNVGSLVASVGSLVFNAVQAVEALVTGPPVLPPGTTVTVRSSTILLGNGQRVAANWYYPEGTDVPKNMILLQHGFLALGPMYSYTAANLAEKTHSIVVTPTLSSNPLAGDANWLGGTAMSAHIGNLFTGSREALTQSAVDAGFATRYGADAVLPQKFALAGHSLGANLVSGAAGFLAAACTVDDCAADDLAGVILLDGVPVGQTLPNALAGLRAKEGLTGFIPVREIGAPWNLYNSFSSVNADLTAARPDRYKGVVLVGGVHSDPMQGGNPLIQFALYVAAGFPRPQNPPAVDQLSVQWFNEWFAGQTDVGDDLVPGTAVDVVTPRGTAYGVVIGNPPAARLLRGPLVVEPSTPVTIPSVRPTLAALVA